jgi:hypothetical protein
MFSVCSSAPAAALCLQYDSTCRMTDQISDAAAPAAINPSCFTCVTCAVRHRRRRFGRKLCHPRMAERRMNRVGGAAIAGEGEGLSTTTAESRSRRGQLAHGSSFQPRSGRGPQSITTGSNYGFRDRAPPLFVVTAPGASCRPSRATTYRRPQEFSPAAPRSASRDRRRVRRRSSRRCSA